MSEQAQGSLVLVVVRQSGRSYKANRIATGDEVTALLRSLVDSTLERISDSNYKDYDPDGAMDGASYLRVPSEELFDVDLLHAMQAAASLSLIDEDEKWHSRLFCYAVAIEDDSQEQTLFVRKANPIQLASKHVVTRLFGHQLDRIEEPILAFDESFDVVIRGGDIYALHHGNFERIFKGTDVVLQRVDAWLTVSFNGLLVEDGALEEFKTRVAGNRFKLRKLQSIARKKFDQPVTIERLKALAASHDMDLDRLFSGDTISLRKDTEDDILTLLNEDVYHGPLTNQSFVASRKSERRARSTS